MTFRSINLALFALMAGAALASPQVHAQDGPPDKDGFRKAISECFKKLGLPEPSPGNPPPRLTEEQRKELDKCLKDAGFDPPDHGRRPPPPRSRHIEPASPEQENSSTAGSAQ